MNNTTILKHAATIAILAILGLSTITASANTQKASKASADNRTSDARYRHMEIQGIDIAYREAGNPSRPTILLLHGFPTSSHMYRELIPQLAETRT